MVLVAVQPGHEHHAGLVEARRRLENMAGQRDGGRQYGVEGGQVALRQRGQRAADSGRDGVEDAQKRIGIPVPIAGDQGGIVEVVTGIHAHRGGQPAPHGDLLAIVQQGDLHPVDLRGVGVDDGQRRLHRRHVVGLAPVAVQRRVEHLAQPVNDDRLPHGAEDARIDALIIGRAAGGPGQRARRHQDDAAAHRFHRLALLLIGADDVVHRDVRAGR